MEALVFFGIVVLGAVVIAPVLAFIAFSRTGRHERSIEGLMRALDVANDRIASLEKAQILDGVPADARVALEDPTRPRQIEED